MDIKFFFCLREHHCTCLQNWLKKNLMTIQLISGTFMMWTFKENNTLVKGEREKRKAYHRIDDERQQPYSSFCCGAKCLSFMLFDES